MAYPTAYLLRRTCDSRRVCGAAGTGSWFEASPGAAHFKDLNGDAWYTEAVNAAYESGIVQGTNELSFEPDRTISREEMAVMIVRAWRKKIRQTAGRRESGLYRCGTNQRLGPVGCRQSSRASYH